MQPAAGEENYDKRGTKLGLSPQLDLISEQEKGLWAGFIFGHLARNPHFDNVTRRHGYSRGPSGFCEWRRGGVISKKPKGPFDFWGGLFEGLRAPSQKAKRPFFLQNKPIKNDTTPLRHSQNQLGLREYP